jgi:hypothetical protein
MPAGLATLPCSQQACSQLLNDGGHITTSLQTIQLSGLWLMADYGSLLACSNQVSLPSTAVAVVTSAKLSVHDPVGMVCCHIMPDAAPLQRHFEVSDTAV